MAHARKGACLGRRSIRTDLSAIIRIVSKVTLSLDGQVVERAKRYARSRGTSVSRLVEGYLGSLTYPEREAGDPPVLRSLRGLLRKGELRDYRRHLAEKYR